MKIFTSISLLFFLHFANANAAISSWNKHESKGAETRILASFYHDKINSEKKLIAGIEFKIADGWKIYGNDSSGFGLPPSFSLVGTKNYISHENFWPEAKTKHEKIGNEEITYSIYEKNVVLPIKIQLAQIAPTELKIKVEYGLCKDVCIPVSEEFDLKVDEEIHNEALAEIQKFLPEKIYEEIQKVQVPKKTNPIFTLIIAILFAVLGGAILNIMPCVLPVLSLKLISVIKHSDSPISRIRFAFFATILGILSCFIFFALLAYIIQFTGNSLGWGLQFQNPYFLIFLVLILTGFIANLTGIFEINFDVFLANFLNKKIASGEKSRNIFIPNFLSGVLAVLLATPCSAPFLGSAISFALAQESSIIFLIFICIGIGFALPYIILLITPNLVRLLPKPGNWMIKVKQLLAWLLGATIIWLLYVLSHNIGDFQAFLVGVFAAIVLKALKIKSDFFRYLAISALIISSFSLPVKNEQSRGHKNQESEKISNEVHEKIWRKFDEAELYRQVIRGKTVVVDITADWCLTCKFNKVRVLQDEEVVKELRSGDIIAMRGDITKMDKEIMNFLHKHNRFAIPFNVVYGPQAKTGLLTSELLTKKELLDLINQARGN
jgi:suppressor for copper-sensitivity B